MKTENENNIYEGEELVSEHIQINGYVEADTIIEAINLQIDGATHQDSMQFARNAKINVHQGTLRCNNAHINILEGGEIHATTAHIKSALNGTIYAQDVVVDYATDDLKVFASKSITIKSIDGNNNIFKINYKEIPIINSKLDLIKEDISDLNYSLKEAQKHNLSQITSIESKIKKFEDELNAIKNSARNAKITIEKSIGKSNKIIFELTTGEELIYETQDLNYSSFYLEFKKDKVLLQPVNKTFTLNS